MTRMVHLASVACAALAAPLAAQNLVLTNARILDPVSRTELHGSIWIEDGRVLGTGPQPPAGVVGQRIDLGGQWVIPGLVDLHTHSFGNAAPGRVSDGGGTARTSTRVLRAGVVAFLDLFALEDYILELRDQQREEAGDGAYIFAAGPCFTAPRGHCSEYGIPTRTVSTPAEARQQVIEVVAKRPDVIKIVYDHVNPSPNARPSIDRVTFREIIATATAFGVPTVVHVGSWEDVRHAALAGATAVTHVPRDGIVPDDVIALMAASRVSHIPTLVVHSDLAEFVDNPALMDDPLVSALAADTIRATYKRGASQFDEPTRRWLDLQRTRKADTFESVRRLHAAGVPMLVGSDAGNWGVIQGYSVHREMIRLVEAGLSPWEALAAGSTSGAAFLGRRFGVRPGDEAHLVVLDASPLERIENTQRITYMIQRGKVVFRR